MIASSDYPLYASVMQKMIRVLIVPVLIFSLLCPSAPAIAESSQSPARPKRKRNYIFPQLGTLFLPGLDQYINGQPETAIPLSILGGTGIGLNYIFGRSLKADHPIDSRDDDARFAALGFEMYAVAGGISMYHSFRDAVETRSEDFPFLKARDTDWDIALSPLRMDYIIRPTTFLPLLAQAGIVALIIKSHPYYWQGLTLGDGFFATTLSAGAGTWEECAFRGWMMPVFRKWVQHDFLSNAMTATIFGAAHLSKNNHFPIFQFLSGLYLGYLTQHNEWSVSESIFVHTWIDIIAFSAAYAFGADEGAHIQVTPIVLTF